MDPNSSDGEQAPNQDPVLRQTFDLNGSLASLLEFAETIKRSFG
jgi:hypothetical protein